MKTNYCINCQCKIDIRSKRCYKCRALHVPSFKGKTHSDSSKEKIGGKSKEKFTSEFKEKVYRCKSRGNKKKAINGYILIKNYDHPNRNKHNDILEHILVMSLHLGRALLKGEVVHHINGDRIDNRIENLYLFSSRSEHMKAHTNLNKLAKDLLNLKVIKFENGEYKLEK